MSDNRLPDVGANGPPGTPGSALSAMKHASATSAVSAASLTNRLYGGTKGGKDSLVVMTTTTKQGSGSSTKQTAERTNGESSGAAAAIAQVLPRRVGPGAIQACGGGGRLLRAQLTPGPGPTSSGKKLDPLARTGSIPPPSLPGAPGIVARNKSPGGEAIVAPRPLSRSGSVTPLRSEEVAGALERLPQLPAELQQQQDALVPVADASGESGGNAETSGAESSVVVDIPRQLAAPNSIPGLEGLQEYRGPVNIETPHEFIAMVRRNPNSMEFLYLNPVMKGTNDYNPYQLRVVSHNELDPNDFYTISAAGVTHVLDGEAEFTPLDGWEREQRLYSELVKIRLFAKHRLWKAYSVWRRNVRSKKIASCRALLQKNLFFLNPCLRPALLAVREICHHVSNMRLYDIVDNMTYDLGEFCTAQSDQLLLIEEKLAEVREVVKDTVKEACDEDLEQSGLGNSSSAKPKPAAMQLAMLDGQLEGASYTEQAARRTHCKRLTCFIKLADYLVTNTLHMLTVTSASDLLSFFAVIPHTDGEAMSIEHVESESGTAPNTRPPSVRASRRSTRSYKDTGAGDAGEEDDEEPGVPLFKVDLILEDDIIEYVPSANIFQSSLNQIVGALQECVLTVEKLVTDDYFEMYTKPQINDIVESKEVGEGPSLVTMFEDDQEFQDILSDIRDALTVGFDTAQHYTNKFELFRDMYVRNENLDLGTFSDPDNTVELYSSSLAKFHLQKKQVDDMKESGDVGLVLVDSKQLKSLLKPCPQRCLVAVQAALPVLSKARNEKLLSTISESLMMLTSNPITTNEYVESLTFVEQIKEGINDIQADFQVVVDMYALIDEYRVTVPPEDFALYQTLRPTLQQLKEAVEKAHDAREDDIIKFSAELDKDISELRAEVLQLKQRGQQELVFDPKSDTESVISFLEKLATDMEVIKQRAADYNGYQSHFGVPTTRFTELDDTYDEIHLKKIMWESIHEWNGIFADVNCAPFESIDCDEVNGHLQRFAKVLYQLEKGLPINNVLPKLKNMVEDMRNRLPVIMDLRNQVLKERHWEAIEAVIQHKLERGDDSFTLSFLEERNVFEFKDQISEISAQATNEAALEQMLHKVEEAWANLEFIVLPHRDNKDVYILSGIDEVQVQLEDSQVTIATIKGSRYVEPIKKQVEEWDKNLTLFAETLDEWMTCQRNWLYLESIFTAPDIQRQLPAEAKMFAQVDKNWKEVMRKTNAYPNAIKAGTAPGLVEQMQNNNALLDQIQKCLEDYLESKRLLFPRFYFLSNDELLEILAQTRNPQAVQPHMRKCFDAIVSLEFGPEVKSIDILSMCSAEGEKVSLGKNLKARGNVETWLGSMEEAMVNSLRRLIKTALAEYQDLLREEWVMKHAGQVVLSVSQIMWCAMVTSALNSANVSNSIKEMERQCVENLARLATIVRGDLTPLRRSILSALITLDVHSRDIVTGMIDAKVSGLMDFEWTKQQRYYWDADAEQCLVKMSNSEFNYGYEYLGCSSRLVITPLTDRCYLCLTGAMQVHLGGAPAGPAGTGKTETVKDLAKSIARQCVVFNCSDGLDYKMMGKFFAGLAQSGAWCCFDEFNRIDIEVLSVIAQQLLTIRHAKIDGLERFLFENRDIRLVQTCAVFITMNPGYAGRTELPDNLKAMFRPFAMMVPDYALIAEVILYSEGFSEAKLLARKMVQMYKLCSEQLSQQDHYDFGMRAVKSVLVMAGALKRANPDLNEDVVLIRACRDANLPKFLAQDVPLFHGILADLFPGINIPKQDYGVLQTAITDALRNSKLQVEDNLVSKVIELHETMVIRHGVMLVGPAAGGKTTCYRALAEALTTLRQKGHRHPHYQQVQMNILNPKAISMGELYGEFNPLTLEWADGLLATMIRVAVSEQNSVQKWMVCDGPVDALWIESMNTVLDDNKTLCLTNGERIKLNPTIHVLFEVQDLAVASPATVSRCGMVYLDPAQLGWQPSFKSWAEAQDLSAEVRAHVVSLFLEHVDPGLRWVRRCCVEEIATVDFSRVQSMCKLMESLFKDPQNKLNLATASLEDAKSFLNGTFIFSWVWGLAGMCTQKSKVDFDVWARGYLGDNLKEMPFPAALQVFSYFFDVAKCRFQLWEEITPGFRYDRQAPYFSILVPTGTTTAYKYLFEHLMSVDHSVLFTGPTGVGKSVIIQDLFSGYSQDENSQYVPLTLMFSAQSSALATQNFMENKLEKKRKNLFSAPDGKRALVFIDDLNMPKQEEYGAQPPIELLRQMKDYGGFYDREKLFWKEVKNVVLSAACAPPGGGRSATTPRFVRHFTTLAVPTAENDALKKIFGSILDGFFDTFNQEVKACSQAVVNGCVEVYTRLASELLPTPAKSHYTFNLRDLSKCVQGILQATPDSVSTQNAVVRLFCHEALRVFHDRLVDHTDKSYFHNMLSDVTGRYFGTAVPADSFVKNPLLFGSLINSKGNRYDDMTDTNKLALVLEEALDEYNLGSSQEMKLVFFQDAIEHIVRITRIIRQPRGNALLVGVGGTGKQSLTRLSAAICDFKCFQIELVRGYGYTEFREDIKQLFISAGAEGKDTVFLFTDTQIVQETFLEDINNILNSGEVPNLFELDEQEKILADLQSLAKDKGISQDRDSVYKFFVDRVREHLHIVLCMSPVGDAFRNRCRMFPSLVNCCTIDWFTKWPREALLSVAQKSFEFFDLGSDEMKEKIGQLCCTIHQSVSEISELFYAEMRRHYYTTPTSYLELINLYTKLLMEKRKEMGANHERVKKGLKKLLETNEVVENMGKELTALQPQLAEKSAATEKLLVQLQEDQEKADAVRKVVLKDEAAAKEQANETEAIAAEAQRDLDEALPALEAAFAALDSLDKSDIAEVRVFSKPPEMVMTVMEAICVLFNMKPSWESSKQLLSNPHFLSKMVDYDKDNIPDSTIRKLKKYIENPKFTPEIVEKTSKACKSMCMWVRALELYAKVFKTVQPKRERLEAASKSLEETKMKLQEKQNALAQVEAQIDKLQKTYEASLKAKKDLTDQIEQTKVRLDRASKLTSGLADEQVRWAETVETLDGEIKALVGNVFLAAACVAYYGAFTSSYRVKLVKGWVKECQELGIPVSDSVNVVDVLSSSFEVREWNVNNLPRDQLSTENAVLVTRGRRWPLMIDPQGQANKWIRTMEAKNGLKIIKLTDPNFLRTLENAIRLGSPVLLEELGETLDPALEPILLKQTYRQGGRLLIRIGDNDIDYDKNFRFYMTTKMANPHYLPEVCIKVTVINFTVTQQGLEDQLLSDVVRLERPDLEEQKNKLVVSINNDKNALKAIEDKILNLLENSEGNILDDTALITALNDSKVTSAAIQERVKGAEETEREINTARAKYRVVSTRGMLLYFVIADVGLMDPMYQYSLSYFKSFFNATIENSEAADTLDRRLDILLKNITSTIFRNVSRGLFEEHKLIFSFMIAIAILINSGEVTPTEWSFFLRGTAPGAQPNQIRRPDVAWLNAKNWDACAAAAQALPCFKDLCTSISEAPDTWIPFTSSTEPHEAPLPTPFNTELTPLQKVILVRLLREERLVFSVSAFVRKKLGQPFIESPPIELSKVYEDTSPRVPLIFILSTGSDPTGALMRFAEEKKMKDQLKSCSLGQGQGPVAEKVIAQAAKNGQWAYLQNCHLAASWMLNLENIIKGFNSPDAAIHPDFRLFLSSMPSKVFPVSVLQNGVKVTNEPPKGLRANLLRSFTEIKPDYYEDNPRGQDWKTMLFGLCFFHANIQERKKFGPLGWNIRYEFNDSDREMALATLKRFLEQNEETPWDALTFLTSQITYGGRVTDDWDKRCLSSILTPFFSPQVLEADYQFSSSGIYHPPGNVSHAECKAYIESLPFDDQPEIFGLHPNANITFNVQETQKLIKCILDVQPRVASGSAGKTDDEIVSELAAQILEQLPNAIDMLEADEEMFGPQEDLGGKMNSLSTLLEQEVTRFNRLLKTMKSTLGDLIRAVKGLVVMSPALERMFHALLGDEVPHLWTTVAYPSLKPLGSWVSDFHHRMAFIRRWVVEGPPVSYWISAFFFPQGFLTGALQNHARKYGLSVDALNFAFKPLVKFVDVAADLSASESEEQSPNTSAQLERPSDGVLVHGLYMDGAMWSTDEGTIVDSLPGQMRSQMPVIHFAPKESSEVIEDPLYACPLYKTSVRAGTLSTTGHSTNFVIAVELPTTVDSSIWIARACALLCQLDD